MTTALAYTRDPATLSPFERFVVSFPPELRVDAVQRFYEQHTALEREQLRYAWYRLHARPAQRMPPGEWDTWMVRAGRGFGKTRTGAESVRRRVNAGEARYVTLIGPTAADSRDVMIEGESGLLAVHPPDTRPKYEPSKRLLTWPNGAIGHVRSAEEPDGLRGLNSDLIWGDEPACLVADTLVETHRGRVRIIDVRADDLVLTRHGYRTVLWSGPTRPDAELVTIHTTHGSLTCTPDHLIATDTGWIPASAVTPSSRLASWENTSMMVRQRGSRGAASAGTATAPATTRIAPATCSTARSTALSSDRSLTTTTCTTSTATRRTTIRRISNASITAHTRASTTWRRLSRSPSNATQRSRRLVLAATGRTGNRGPFPALDAESRSSRLVSARRSARHGAVLRPTVLAVEPCLHRAQTYDLTVADVHEFIADGVVVHNSWKTGSAAWDNASLGNRLGTPKAILTGTPRPLPWLRELEREAGTVVTLGATFDNVGNLADAFVRLIVGRYQDTRLGLQELFAQYLDDTEGAFWKLRVIEQWRIATFDRARPAESLIEALVALSSKGVVVDLGRIAALRRDRRRWRTIVAVDPPGETAECGIVIGTAPERGKMGVDHCVILGDDSLAGTPEEWGAQVVKAFRAWNAEAVYVESNQGGDMCRAVIHAVDATVPVKKIRAKVSKKERAQPVSALYEAGWIHHWGQLPKLEDQQTTWVPDESPSPDRLDAAVHCVRELLEDSIVAPAKVVSPVNRRI